MKNCLITATLLSAAAAFAQTPTSEFTGYYLGAQLGSNHSKSSANRGYSNTSTYPGLVAGYAVESNGLLIGVEAFADYHNRSTTNKDAGVGLKLGKVVSDVLLYARVGATGSKPSWRPQYGLGLETKLNKELSLNVLVAGDKTNTGGYTRENNNFSLGVNYYFK